VDPGRASVARMYDFVLGGKDHYQVDRDELVRLQQVLPEVADLALENRRYLIRVCRFLAERAGVDQYLDCGSGLPTTENVHQVVQRVEKLSKVVYVDNDPVVVAHGRACWRRTTGPGSSTATSSSPRRSSATTSCGSTSTGHARSP
jgi:hypothetical protein